MSTIVLRLLIPTALALGLVGCVADAPAEPEPQFSSESEAFAAAEATYRAYVDALNQVDLSDPETFEAVYAWTTGEANAGARESFTGMHADGLAVSGETRYDSVSLLSFTPDESGTVVASLCVDVADVELHTPEGESAVPAQRPDRQPLVVTFDVDRSSDTGMRIAASSPDGSRSCS